MSLIYFQIGIKKGILDNFKGCEQLRGLNKKFQIATIEYWMTLNWFHGLGHSQ